MTKKITTVLIVLLIVFIAVAVWVVVKLGETKGIESSPYSAVYLTNGDIYFGKFNTFPNPRISSVWLLQRSTDAQNRPQLSIAPMSNAFWGPSDAIYLNPNQIIFWTKLKKDSQVAQVIANPGLLNQLPPAPATPAAPNDGKPSKQ